MKPIPPNKMPVNRDVLLQHKYFYHVTGEDRVESIMKKGLIPCHDDEEMYVIQFGQRRPLFFCTEQSIPRAIDMMRGKHNENGNETVVLRVPAHVVADFQCVVDISFPQATDGMDFDTCMSEVGYFACIGTIEPQHIKRYDPQRGPCPEVGRE